jgi:hypothetical protein
MLEFIRRKTRGFTVPPLQAHYEEELLLNEDNDGSSNSLLDEPVDHYHLVYSVKAQDRLRYNTHDVS